MYSNQTGEVDFEKLKSKGLVPDGPVDPAFIRISSRACADSEKVFLVVLT